MKRIAAGLCPQACLALSQTPARRQLSSPQPAGTEENRPIATPQNPPGNSRRPAASPSPWNFWLTIEVGPRRKRHLITG